MTLPTFPTAEQLMEDACHSTGLDDFGAGELVANLTRFLSHVEHEGNLNARAIGQLMEQVRRRLINRLEIEAWYRTHREVEQIEIGQVTSITGLPRTGTTALANILSLDDQFRSLRSWEQNRSCPPPVLGREESDPRRLAAIEYRERIAHERSDLVAMHLWEVDTTEEDVELLGLSFQAQQFDLPIFGYHEWWRDANLKPAFQYHQRVLKLLQSYRPPDNWLLKAPAHCFHLKALCEVYPQIRFVMTHRDPAKTVASTISLISALYAGKGQVDIREVGRMGAEHFRIGMERAMTAREQLGEDRFLDIHHRDFVTAPFESLQRIYDFLGMETHPRTRRKMEAWHRENRVGAHGKHSYSPEQFGLTAERLRSDFDSYIRRFNVHLEQ